jgi:predicted transcriptional regulator
MKKLITFKQIKKAVVHEYGFDDDFAIEQFVEATNIDELVSVLDMLGYNNEEAYKFIFDAIIKQD